MTPVNRDDQQLNISNKDQSSSQMKHLQVHPVTSHNVSNMSSGHTSIGTRFFTNHQANAGSTEQQSLMISATSASEDYYPRSAAANSSHPI